MSAANWDNYRFFLAAVRGGTLSAAARALKVAQPTAGRRIEALEQEVGPLFDRDAQGMSLTPLGEEILPHVEAMAQQASALEQCAVRHRSGVRRTVFIATTMGLSTHWLAEKTALLRVDVPDLRVSVRVGIPRADLIHHEADIALRMGSPAHDDLVGRRCGKIGCGLYASRAYLEQNGSPASLEALDDHTLVDSEGEIADLPQVKVLRHRTAAAAVALGCDSVTVQIAALKAGLGIAPVPCFMAEPSPVLVRLLPELFHVEVDLWLLVNPRLKHEPTVRRVLDHLHEEAVRDASRLAGRPGEASPSP
ncbi:MAG: LysR family transcriptional regulator [Myxococcota bacterium]